MFELLVFLLVPAAIVGAFTKSWKWAIITFFNFSLAVANLIFMLCLMLSSVMK